MKERILEIVWAVAKNIFWIAFAVILYLIALLLGRGSIRIILEKYF